MSAIGSVQASGGVFSIMGANGQKQQVDLGTLMMMLNLDRTKNLDSQIAIQLSEIQERNNKITQLTEFLSACRSHKASGKDDGCPDGSKSSDGSGMLTIGGVTKSIQGVGGWAETLGIQWTDVQWHRDSSNAPGKDQWNAQWDANISAIRGKIDTMNNDSQMANIKLQNLLEKRGNSFEMATKVMDTNNQSIQSILRNL